MTTKTYVSQQSVSLPDDPSYNKYEGYAFSGVNFVEGSGSVADFLGCTFYGCTFEGVDTKYINFTQSQLLDTTFEGGKFNGVRFFNSALTRCNFDDVDLSGSLFDNTKVHGSTFNGAVFAPAMYSTTLFRCSGYPREFSPELGSTGRFRLTTFASPVASIPSGEVTIGKTTDGYVLVIGCWSGTVLQLERMLEDPATEWPEEYIGPEARERRTEYLRAVLPLIELKIKSHSSGRYRPNDWSDIL